MEPVQSFLPEFQTSQDPEITKCATLLDFCSHGTGLAPVDHLVCGFHDESWILGEQQVQTTSQLPACYDFRSNWLYNNSIIGVVSKLITKVLAQNSEDFLKERTFGPLRMTRSVTRAADQPTDGNFVRGCSVLDDGSLRSLSLSALDDGSPQGGAGYVRSSVRDMLIWVRAVMEVEVHNFDQDHTSLVEQDGNGSRNPLCQMQLLRCGHRPVTLQGTGYENTYELGGFRHMLPSSWLGSIGPSFALLPDPPIINKAEPPRLTIAHWGECNGFLTALYTFPATQSAVIIMANSAPGRGCPVDLAAQMLVQELFNMQPQINFDDYAIEAAETSKRLWPALVEEWVFNRVRNTNSGQIEDYVGSFTNRAYSLIINVYKVSPDAIGPEHPPELLGFKVNSISRQSAKLRHYHDDTWTFLPDSRDDASRKSMEGFLSLPILLLLFVRDKAGVVCSLD